MNDPIEKAKEIIEEFKHYGPGPHKGSGTPQSVHAGFKKMGGAGVLQAVGGMERTQAREYVARLRAANPKKQEAPKPTVPGGNGNYGNDGTATEKQVDFAKKLVGDATVSWDDVYGKIPGNADAETRVYLTARKASDVIRNAISPTGLGRMDRDTRTEVGKVLHQSSQQWLRSVDPQSMSKAGISKFIDAVKSSSVAAFVGAHTDGSNNQIVNLINNLVGKRIFYIRTDSDGDESTRINDAYMQP